MYICEHKQGTEGWFADRLGIPTASNFSKVMAGGTGATRKAYMMKKIAERLTGLVEEGYSNSSMEWGTETEPQARAKYELRSGNAVVQVGFCKPTATTRWGASPDGLIDDDGMVEFKCPDTTTQMATYLSGKMPTAHKHQVQGQLWVTDRQWCDFVSFDPRITKGDAGYFCVRIERDNDYINGKILPPVARFLYDMDKVMKELGAG